MSAKKTDLIERYLNAVKFWLPGEQQKDILAELAEDLQSQVEERESALGHQLDEDELAALLKRRGSPLRVASGYIPELRLINPAMLPLYWLVLKIVLLWVLAPLFAIVFIAHHASDKGGAAPRPACQQQASQILPQSQPVLIGCGGQNPAAQPGAPGSP